MIDAYLERYTIPITQLGAEEVQYLLDQTPLLNCCRTSRRAERNSHRSRILATGNIRVAHADVNKPRVSDGNIKCVYMLGTRMHAV